MTTILSNYFPPANIKPNTFSNQITMNKIRDTRVKEKTNRPTVCYQEYVKESDPTSVVLLILLSTCVQDLPHQILYG